MYLQGIVHHNRKSLGAKDGPTDFNQQIIAKCGPDLCGRNSESIPVENLAQAKSWNRIETADGRFVATYSLFGLILLLVGGYLSCSRPGIDYLTLGMSAKFFVMSAVTDNRYRDACLTC